MEKISPVPPAPTVFEAASSPPTPPKPLPIQERPADLRLEIDQDPVSGTYIYRTIDRETGDVVQQLPREEVIRLRDAIHAEVGAIIKAKV